MELETEESTETETPNTIASVQQELLDEISDAFNYSLTPDEVLTLSQALQHASQLGHPSESPWRITAY